MREEEVFRGPILQGNKHTYHGVEGYCKGGGGGVEGGK